MMSNTSLFEHDLDESENVASDHSDTARFCTPYMRAAARNVPAQSPARSPICRAMTEGLSAQLNAQPVFEPPMHPVYDHAK